MTEPSSTSYPGHTCACADEDLSQVQSYREADNGQEVMVRCGTHHWRIVPKALWEAELKRRMSGG